MNADEAKQTAIKSYGPHTVVWIRNSGPKPYKIGTDYGMGCWCVLLGEGNSWEEAFSDVICRNSA